MRKTREPPHFTENTDSWNSRRSEGACSCQWRRLKLSSARSGLLIFRPEPCGDSFLDVGESLLFVLPLRHTSGQGRAFDNHPAIFRFVDRDMKNRVAIPPITSGCPNPEYSLPSTGEVPS